MALLALSAAACAVQEAPIIANGGPDELYADFVDGKFDGAGHPTGAIVQLAKEVCGGVDLAAGDFRAIDELDPGVLCRTPASLVGRGRYAVNVRAALLVEPCAEVDGVTCDASTLTLVVSDAMRELARKTFDRRSFGALDEAVNLSLEATTAPGELTVELRGANGLEVAVAYFELFRMDRGLILEPASGALEAEALLAFDAVDPPEGPRFRVRCGETDLSPTLEALLAAGIASEVTTEFRYRVQVAATELLAGCAPFSPFVVELVGAQNPGWVRATREARYLAAAPACDFLGEGKRVLLTGFVPFPAGGRAVNISQVAVERFDPAQVPGAAVMKLILPVEFDTAPAWIAEVIARCDPEIIIGFGQGRSQVDVELKAYNRKDTSEVPGGVPDNRGAIFDGHSIEAAGPDEIDTALPAQAIVAALRGAQVAVGASTDPGRYVCNNVFYATSRAAGSARKVGFIHLPRRFSIGEAEQDLVATVVKTALVETLRLP